MPCILEYFARLRGQTSSEEEDEEEGNLASLGCVAKEWLAHCRALLYHSFRATDGDTIELFTRTLEERIFGA
jgi:hypothetical protein